MFKVKVTTETDYDTTAYTLRNASSDQVERIRAKARAAAPAGSTVTIKVTRQS